jgi:hypothetical protein
MSFNERMRRADEAQNRQFGRSLQIARATGVEETAHDRLLDAMERQPEPMPEVLVGADEEDVERWDGQS